MSETQTAIAPTPTLAPAATLLPAEVAEALSEAARVIENIEAPLDVLNLLIERRKALRKELASIDTQIHILGGAIPKNQRMVWQCKRCAYRWQSFSIEPPRACARCRSVGWNKDPVRFSARRPSDPPAPSWKAPSEKDYRRKAARLVPWSSPPVLTEAVAEAAAAAKVESRRDGEKTINLPIAEGLPPPPRASAFAPVMPPARPLSEQLAEAILPPKIDEKAPNPAVQAVQASPAEQVDNPEADAYAPDVEQEDEDRVG